MPSSLWASVAVSVMALATVLVAAVIAFKLYWQRIRFALKSTGGAVPARPPSSLRVLSLNVFTLPWGFSSDGDGDCKNERLSALCQRHLGKFDVVGLQELFGGPSGRRDAVLALAKRAGLKYHAGPFPPRLLSGRLIDGGCVLLSRYPLESVDFHEYRHRLFPDSVSCKGVLCASLRLGPEASLPVFVTHLQASYSLDDAPSAEVRRRQLEELRVVVEERAGKEGGAVVMGDFNTDAADAAGYAAVQRALPAFEDAVLAKKGSHVPTCCVRFNAETGREVGPCEPVTAQGRHAAFLSAASDEAVNFRDVAQTIDYIFVRSGGEDGLALRIDEAEVEPFREKGPGFESISDHAGVRATLSLQSAAEVQPRDSGHDDARVTGEVE